MRPPVVNRPRFAVQRCSLPWPLHIADAGAVGFCSLHAPRGPASGSRIAPLSSVALAGTKAEPRWVVDPLFASRSARSCCGMNNQYGPIWSATNTQPPAPPTNSGRPGKSNHSRTRTRDHGSSAQTADPVECRSRAGVEADSGSRPRKPDAAAVAHGDEPVVTTVIALSDSPKQDRTCRQVVPPSRGQDGACLRPQCRSRRRRSRRSAAWRSDTESTGRRRGSDDRSTVPHCDKSSAPRAHCASRWC